MFGSLANAVKHTCAAIFGTVEQPNHNSDEAPPPLPERSTKRKREDRDHYLDHASPSAKRSRSVERSSTDKTPVLFEFTQQLPTSDSNFPHYVLASNSVRTHHQSSAGMVALCDTQGCRPALLMSHPLVQAFQVSLEAGEYGFAERSKVFARREVLANFIAYAEAEYSRLGHEFDRLEQAGHSYQDAEVTKVQDRASDIVRRLRVAQEEDDAYGQHLIEVMKFVEVSKLQIHEMMSGSMYDSGLVLHEDVFYGTELPDDFVARWRVPVGGEVADQSEQSAKDVARTDLHRRGQDLLKAQQRFECRREKNRHDYTRETQSDIDVHLLWRGINRTGALIAAEECYATARAEAIKLGVSITTLNQSSGFDNGSDHGKYLNRVCMSVGGPANIPLAQKWLDSLPEDASAIEEAAPEMDDWQAKNVDPQDSISVVATGRGRERIDAFEAGNERSRSAFLENMRSVVASE